LKCSLIKRVRKKEKRKEKNFLRSLNRLAVLREFKNSVAFVEKRIKIKFIKGFAF